jgi:hypothetical protein
MRITFFVEQIERRFFYRVVGENVEMPPGPMGGRGKVRVREKCLKNTNPPYYQF